MMEEDGVGNASLTNGGEKMLPVDGTPAPPTGGVGPIDYIPGEQQRKTQEEGENVDNGEEDDQEEEELGEEEDDDEEEGEEDDEDEGDYDASSALPLSQSAPAPRPRVILKGMLIGLFVVLDPNKQGVKMNMKKELEFMGIYQRDVAAGEEVQLSLEQAFYLMEELKSLEIYLPDDPGRHDEGRDWKPLDALESWKVFSAVSPTFSKSVGSYRYFRRQGFVVHGGLNLGLDFMLYRGSPQRYHAEFGVLLRFPSTGSSAGSSRTGKRMEEEDDKVLSWRALHLLYRLIGEVRKTLVLGHVRLGCDSEDDKNLEEEKQDDAQREMSKWYTNMSLYEVTVTPWRADTPLARISKAARDAVQIKRGGEGGGGGRGRKRGRNEEAARKSENVG